jgi:proteasome lid subunit RPN8/RPN11
MPKASISISMLLWFQLLRELKSRGRKQRESGAFLLGKKGFRKICHFIPYDDLDPHCLDTGIIRFDGAGFVPLWAYCKEHRMEVLADVHTHPGTWTGQSELDRTHPMISIAGYTALIVPSFAQHTFKGLAGVGVYEYEGGHQWKTWSTRSNYLRLTLL